MLDDQREAGRIPRSIECELTRGLGIYYICDLPLNQIICRNGKKGYFGKRGKWKILIFFPFFLFTFCIMSLSIVPADHTF